MKATDSIEAQDTIVAKYHEEHGTQEMKLGLKYQVTLQYKFRGKKRRASNEGRTGVTARRAKRCITAGCKNLRKAKKS